MESAELASFIAERYKSLLGEAERQFEKFGGRAAIEAAEAPQASERDRKMARAVREFASVAASIRMGGDADAVDFICGRDCFVGIEKDDPDGLAKMLAQLPTQPLAVLLEVQKCTVELSDRLANRLADVLSPE